jgi:hypothetical protein
MLSPWNFHNFVCTAQVRRPVHNLVQDSGTETSAGSIIPSAPLGSQLASILAEYPRPTCQAYSRQIQ